MKWLETSLDYGLSEAEFWNMTIAEIGRYVESKNRVQKRQLQERAVFDYTLSNLIAKSVSRLLDSNSKMPDITDVYPELFDKEEIEAQRAKQEQEAFAIKLKQFTQNFNLKFNKEV